MASARRIIALAIGLAFVARPAAAVPVGPSADGSVTFTTPSNNIECIYIPPGGTPVYKPPRGEAELSCDRAEPAYIRIGMSATGRTTIARDVGDRSCCTAEPVLNYGESVRTGPFTCQSEREGLTCRRDDGPGFRVSRARADLF